MSVSLKALKLKDLEDMTPERIQEWTSVLKDMGFHFKKIPSRKSSPKKKLSNEEKSLLDFDPNLCHARAFKPKKHPGTDTDMYKAPKHTLVCGIIAMQCTVPKHDGGNLCAGHAPTNTSKFADHFRCCKQGLFLGLYNEACPEKPIRHHKGNGLDGKVKEFIWIENTDEKYDKYKTDADSTKSKSKSPKSKSPSKEKKPKEKKETPKANYGDFNWEELISTGGINSLKKFELITYIQEHNLEIKGHCKTLIAGIIDHFNIPDEEESGGDSDSDNDSGDDSDSGGDSEDSGKKSENEDSGGDSDSEEEEDSGKKSENEDSGGDSDSDSEEEESCLIIKIDSDKKSDNEDSGGDSDSNSDEDDEDDEDDEKIEKEMKKIEGVEYYIEGNNFFDIENKTHMGRIDKETKKGYVFTKKTKKLHKENVKNLK